MLRLIKVILKNPLLVFTLLFWNLRALIYHLRGFKTIIYNLHHDYFFDVFEPIRERLARDPKIRILYSCGKKNEKLWESVCTRAQSPVIDSFISPFIYSEIFVSAEVAGPDFPFRLVRCPRVEIYHGTGTYSLPDNLRHLYRFHVHFAVGPQVKTFFDNNGITDKNGYRQYLTGYAKTDKIVNNSYDNNAIIEEYGISGKPVVIYAPHWNECSSLHKFGEELIRALASLDIFLLVRPHNYLFTAYAKDNWRERLENLENELPNMRYVRDPDTQKFYNITAAMVTDVGTTAPMEYSLTGKPYFIFNDPGWFSERQGSQPETDLVEKGIRVASPEELISILGPFLNGDAEAARVVAQLKTRQDEMVKQYFYNPGKASEAAETAIRKELGLGTLS